VERAVEAEVVADVDMMVVERSVVVVVVEGSTAVVVVVERSVVVVVEGEGSVVVVVEGSAAVVVVEGLAAVDSTMNWCRVACSSCFEPAGL